MTTERIENAIRHIKTSVDIDPWALETAIMSLQKQKPRPPARIKDRYHNVTVEAYSCPVCSKIIEYTYSTINGQKISYCGHCGQCISWEEVEKDG